MARVATNWLQDCLKQFEDNHTSLEELSAVYIRTLWRTLARQSGQVASACWQDEQEQRWPQGRKIISHWKQGDTLHICPDKKTLKQMEWKNVSLKSDLSLQADDALSRLESLNRSRGVGVLGSGRCLAPIFLQRCTGFPLLWTCTIIHFNLVQNRMTFRTDMKWYQDAIIKEEQEYNKSYLQHPPGWFLQSPLLVREQRSRKELAFVGTRWRSPSEW